MDSFLKLKVKSVHLIFYSESSAECELYGCFWESQSCKSAPISLPSTESTENDNKKTTTIVIVVTVIVALIIIVAAVAFYIKINKEQHPTTPTNSLNLDGLPAEKPPSTSTQGIPPKEDIPDIVKV